MAVHDPIYRYIVKKLRSVDTAETATMVPTASGALHSDAFKVASKAIPLRVNQITEVQGVGTSIVLNVPSNTEAGDLLLVFIVNDDAFAGTTPPAGWVTEKYNLGAFNQMASGIYRRVATGSEAGSYTWTLSLSEGFCAAMLLIKNPNDNWLDVAISLNEENNVDPTALGVTTVTDDALVLRATMMDGGNAQPFTVGDETEQVDLEEAGECNLNIVSNLHEAGATGDFQWSPSDIDQADSYTVAIRPGEIWKPYLKQIPQGRRGSLDLLRAKTDIGMMRLVNLDKRIGSDPQDNSARWFTQFIGDATGREALRGAKVIVEESLDDGDTWSDFYTGRIAKWKVSEALDFILELRDINDDFDRKIFVGRPHTDISYAQLPWVLPLGLENTYGPFAAKAKLAANYATSAGNTRTITLDDEAISDMRNILTSALFDGSQIDGAGPATRTYVAPEGIRVVYAGGGSGEFALDRYRVLLRDKRNMIDQIEIRQLDSADPDYLAFPGGSESCTVGLRWNNAPTKRTKLYIDDVHPATLMQDLLDGQFSRLNDDGTVSWTFTYDTTVMAAIVADATFATYRGAVDDEWSLIEFLEVLGEGFGLGYRIDPDGTFVPLDLRTPATISGVTIAQTDLVEGSIPAWDVTGRAITKVKSVIIGESERVVNDQNEWENRQPDVVTSLIEERDIPIDFVSFNALLDVGESSHELKTRGYRNGPGEISRQNIKWLLVRRQIERRADDLFTMYDRGAHMVTFRTRRAASVSGANLFLPGDFRLIDFDVVPDASTVQRGGARFVLCTKRREDGPEIEFECLDTGVNVTAAVPTWTSWELDANETRHAIIATISANGDGDPVEIHYAITETSEGTRPVDSDAAWTLGGTMYSGTTLAIRGLPAGKRLWGRARSRPLGLGRKQLSAWVYPSDGTPAGSEDMSAFATPTGLTSSAVTGKNATLSWTNGDAALAVRILFGTVTPAVTTLIDLPAGSTQLPVGDLAISTLYYWSVQHVGPNGSVGAAAATVNFTTAGSATAAPSMGAPIIIIGESVVFTNDLIQIYRTGIYIGPRMSDASLGYQIQYAPDSGGSPDLGDLTVFGRVLAGIRKLVVPFPLDDDIRYFRTRHVGGGFDDGAWSTWSVAARPRLLPDDIADVHVFGNDIPEIVSMDFTISDTGVVDRRTHAIDSGSVKISQSTSSQPVLATVRGESSQDLDANGYLSEASVITLDVGQTLYVSALSYQAASGLGAESPIMFQTTVTWLGGPIVSSVGSTINRVDGSVEIRVEVNALVKSIRYDDDAANPPTWPTDGNVEGGTVINEDDSGWVLNSKQIIISRPADTALAGERYFIRVAPYAATDGLGPDGSAGTHGLIVADLDGADQPEILSVDILINIDTGVTDLVIRTVQAGSIKASVSNSAFPVLATVQAETPDDTDADGLVTKTTVDTLDPNQTLYVSVLAYAAASGGGVEGPVMAKVKRSYGNNPIIQSMASTIDRSDGSVEIRLEVTGLVKSIRYDPDVGAPPAWPSDGDVEGSVSIINEGDAGWVTSSNQIIITLAAATVAGGQRFFIRVAPYAATDGLGPDGSAGTHGLIVADLDGADQPEILSVAITTDEQGRNSLQFRTVQTGSIKFATSTSAYPNATTVRAAGADNVDSDGLYEEANVTTSSGNQTLYVSAFAYSGAAGAGQEGPVMVKQKLLYQSTDLARPRATIQHTASTVFDETFTLSAVAGDGGGTTLTVKYRTKVWGNDWGSFSAWFTAPKTGVLITRDPNEDSYIEVVARDEDRGNIESLPKQETVVSIGRLLDAEIKVEDSEGNFPVFRHEERGTAQHGDPVVFGDLGSPFTTAPGMTFVPQIGLSYRQADSASDQVIDMGADSLSRLGFTQRAQIITGASASAQIDGFSTSRDASAPENGTVSLSTDGDVAYSNLEDANTTSATYFAYFDVDTTLMAVGNDVIVELWTSSLATGGTWTLRNQRTYADGGTWSDENLQTTLSLGADYDLRLRIRYAEAPGIDLAAITALGENSGPPRGVQWDRVDGGTANSMTPNTGDKIQWWAAETNI